MKNNSQDKKVSIIEICKSYEIIWEHLKISDVKFKEEV